MFNPLWMHFVEHLCSPYIFHIDFIGTPPIDFNLTKSKVCYSPLHLDSMRGGVEWKGLEVKFLRIPVDYQ